MGFMDRIKHSSLYKTWLKFLRVLQLLSAIISLGMFSGRIYKVIRLYKRINTASGAVEGILAAAVAYTILATILQLCLRRAGNHKIIRWLLIILDIAFVIAFIVVTVLTRPNGPSGPCRRSTINNLQNPTQYQTANCNLPWGTFILAIFSTCFMLLLQSFTKRKIITRTSTTTRRRMIKRLAERRLADMRRLVDIEIDRLII